VVVDEEEKVIGVISLSDLLNQLVLQPCGEAEEPSAAPPPPVSLLADSQTIPEEGQEEEGEGQVAPLSQGQWPPEVAVSGGGE
jgi:CBS domain-containing protein